MNKRKLADYTSMYEALDTLMKTELPEVELYFEIGWAVCARPEKGAAVMAAEYSRPTIPSTGASPHETCDGCGSSTVPTQIAGDCGRWP